MKKSLATLVFLFSGSVLAESDFTGDFYRALAATGANITVDALFDDPRRLDFIVATWRKSSGKVTVKHFTKRLQSTGKPLNPKWIIDVAREYGGRITFED